MVHRHCSDVYTAVRFGLFSDGDFMDYQPPQAPLLWSLSPEDIRKSAKEAVEKAQNELDEIAALQPSECTFNSVCPAFGHSCIDSPLIGLRVYLHPLKVMVCH